MPFEVISIQVVGLSLDKPEGAVKCLTKYVCKEGCLHWMSQKHFMESLTHVYLLISGASDVVIEKASSHVMPKDAKK